MSAADLPPLCPVHSVKPQYASAPEWCTCEPAASEGAE